MPDDASRMAAASNEARTLPLAALLIAVGATLYAAGTLLTLVHHASSAAQANSPAAIVLRLLALALFAAYAIRRRSLTLWIFWAMLAGIELGLDAPATAVGMRVFSDVFLRLIKTIVAPLILGTLITGIAGHGDLRSVGRLGLKSLVYFEVLTTLALVIGLVAINLSKAGVGLSLPQSATHADSTLAVTSGVAPEPALSWQQFLLHAFPENIAKSVADNQILQVAIFAVIFGIALGRLSAEKRAPMLRLAESLTETMFAFTNIVMYFAPIGVGAAMAYTVGHAGAGVMFNLGKLLITLYVSLIAFALLVMLPVALLARIPLRRFLRAITEPATIAFATSTSEAALPRAMEEMEAMGVSRKITGFVIPMGYSFNLAGSALYLSLASIFVAQAAGIHMGLTQQIFMLLTLMLTSKGIAGVPRAMLVVLLATAVTFHLPEEPIFLLLGIDALMDMGRTTINVVGNCLACVVMAQWEGELNIETPSALALAAVDD